MLGATAEEAGPTGEPGRGRIPVRRDLSGAPLHGDGQGNKLPRINTSSCAARSSRTPLPPCCLMDLLTKWIQGQTAFRAELLVWEMLTT